MVFWSFAIPKLAPAALRIGRQMEASNHSESSEEEGRIAKLIKQAHAAVDSDDDDEATFFELQQAQKEQMLSEGWTAASDAVPNLPPMRPPPLLPPSIAVPAIFSTKVEYDTSHMFNQDLTHEDDDQIVVTNKDVLDNYEILPQVLGSGVTSEVKLVKSKKDEKEAALKVVNSHTCVMVPTTQWYEIEKNLKLCQSPNVITLIEAYSDENGVYLVLERLAGTAAGLLAKRDIPWTEADASKIIAQVLKGLEVMDKNGLVHADVVPGNVLSFDDQVSQVKLSGFAKTVPKDSPLAGRWTSTKFKAPEVLSMNIGGPAVDMWGLGCLAATGKVPFANPNSNLLKDEIIAGKVEYPEFVSPSAREFISGLLNTSPSKRYTIKKAKKHAWIKKHGTDTVVVNFKENIAKFQV